MKATFVSEDLFSLEPGLVGIILRNGLLPGSMHSSSNSSANAFFVPSSVSLHVAACTGY